MNISPFLRELTILLEKYPSQTIISADDIMNVLYDKKTGIKAIIEKLKKEVKI